MATPQQLYRERLSRYMTAMRNEKPDRIPIRPFAAEFTAKYAGLTCQDVVHDYNLAFKAVQACARDFDWDAIVSNMVYVWTGLTQAIGLRYYTIPGIDTPSDVGFQYKEPAEEESFMKEDEYDELIDDPTAFLYNKWLPRVSTEISPLGEAATYRNNLALVKGAMAMANYFNAYGPHLDYLKNVCGMPSSISGIFKAPFDIIGDKLRGYLGLTMDMITQPDKVLKACEALMPHLYNVAKTTADPLKQVPIGYWMHRGCIPFVSAGQFESHYWPTVKPIIEELWSHGNQTLFYGEGNWDWHLESFRDLPEKSIVFHVDTGDIFKTKKVIGDKFCISGGVPNTLMSYGSEDDLRKCVKRIINEVACEGGYIMDCSAIIQNDATVERIKLLTDLTREFGVYSDGVLKMADENEPVQNKPIQKKEPYGMGNRLDNPKIGQCIPFEEEQHRMPPIQGDKELVKKIWDETDAMGNSFIWQCLLSF